MKCLLPVLSLTVAAIGQATWMPQFPATRPAPRESHNLVYDPATQSTLLFFGRQNGLYAPGAFWQWDGSVWMPLTNTVSGFLFLTGTCGLCDDGAGGMLVFGGYQPGFGIGGGTPLVVDRTWQVLTTGVPNLHFTLLSPASAPSARQAPQMVLTNQGVLLFGGANVTAASFHGDTWLWNGATWTGLAPAGAPPARAFHAMAFDSARNVVVMFGGAVGASTVANDTWEFNGTTWQQRFPAHQPPPRCRAAFAYSPALGRCVLFGGGIPNGTGNLGDTWTWDGTDWQQPVLVAPAPAARQGAAMSYDPAQQRVFLFGGRDGPTHFDDSWYLDLQSSPSTYTLFGAGCLAPNNVVPSLFAVQNEVPSLGSTSHLVIGNLPAGTLTLPVFVLGLSNTFEPNPGHPLPLDLGFLGWPGCQQLVSHDVFEPFPTLASSVTLPFAVPANAGLIGAAFHAQGIVLYTPAGAAVSNAITGVVGS